ncbi:uncharacterized protein LOC115329648 [Ixodes scapularis]|uniref:uncharacterized protein LOC115329648 n=1 Tax=Ixodes scapularis TaxID=6945 RepID=UPI0011616A69|nr:uncharacterized protein LOC115329648 [Ixodes scapularis]
MALPWVDELKLWPKIQRSFIYEYMITRQDIDGKPSQNFKGFVEALNLLDSGHVGAILVRQEAGLCELQSQVRSSQTVSKLYETQVTFTDNVITSIVCSCMAGQGQSCSHAAALLFKVAEASSRGLTGSACTDVQCKWNASTAKNVVPAPLEVIYGLKSGKAGFPQFDSHRALQEHIKRSGFRNIEGTILASVMGAQLKNAPLQVVRGPQSHGCHSGELICGPCKSFYDANAALTAAAIASLEEQTRGQDSSQWQTARKRLNNTFRGNENTRHGKKTEPKARAWYEEDQDCVLRLCGLTVHEGNPWLAASPDGLKAAGNVLVEIKCPTPDTLKKYGSLECLFASGKYDVRYDGPDLILSPKGKNAYYTQVQLQLYCSGQHSCNFEVFAEKKGYIAKVPYNKAFIESLLPKLKSLYFEHYLPAPVDEHAGF